SLSQAAHAVLPSFPTRRSSDLAPRVLPELYRHVLVTLTDERPVKAFGAFGELGEGGLQDIALFELLDLLLVDLLVGEGRRQEPRDRKSTRLNSSHVKISYAVFC